MKLVFCGTPEFGVPTLEAVIAAGHEVALVVTQPDRAAGRRIACPLLALWSAAGALDTWYAGDSGPLALWQAWSDDVRGDALDGGHFFPEEAPERTAEALERFFTS